MALQEKNTRKNPDKQNDRLRWYWKTREQDQKEYSTSSCRMYERKAYLDQTPKNKQAISEIRNETNSQIRQQKRDFWTCFTKGMNATYTEHDGKFEKCWKPKNSKVRGTITKLKNLKFQVSMAFQASWLNVTPTHLLKISQDLFRKCVKLTTSQIGGIIWCGLWSRGMTFLEHEKVESSILNWQTRPLYASLIDPIGEANWQIRSCELWDCEIKSMKIIQRRLMTWKEIFIMLSMSFKGSFVELSCNILCSLTTGNTALWGSLYYINKKILKIVSDPRSYYNYVRPWPITATNSFCRQLEKNKQEKGTFGKYNLVSLFAPFCLIFALYCYIYFFNFCLLISSLCINTYRLNLKLVLYHKHNY